MYINEYIERGFWFHWIYSSSLLHWIYSSSLLHWICIMEIEIKAKSNGLGLGRKGNLLERCRNFADLQSPGHRGRAELDAPRPPKVRATPWSQATTVLGPRRRPRCASTSRPCHRLGSEGRGREGAAACLHRHRRGAPPNYSA